MSIAEEMVDVVRNCRSGVSLVTAAAAARVEWRTVLAWLDLAARGEEPFVSFRMEIDAARAELQCETMRNLARMARVDPHAANLVLRRLDAMPNAPEPSRIPLPKARSEMARERSRVLETMGPKWVARRLTEATPEVSGPRGRLSAVRKAPL